MTQSKLMSDREVQQFIVNGYTIVRADMGADFHEGVRKKLDHVFDEEGNPGNNILPRVPEIRQVFDHPNVRGALTSLLGEGYILNPHRHCHLNPVSSPGQKWHKDCYVYDNNLRHPRFDWILAFYYPQDTTADMGPSAILPGTQFHKTISSAVAAETKEPDLKVTGPEGTVALIHFDSWHRASANRSQTNRYMLKFQFARTQRHESPTWDHRSAEWSPGIEDSQSLVSRDVWSWIRGEPSVVGLNGSDASEGEETELSKAYKAAESKSQIPELVNRFCADAIDTVEETTAKTQDNAHGTNPTPVPLACALSHSGTAAVGEVASRLDDPSWWVRANCAHILYKIGRDSGVAEDAVVRAAEDSHWWVRRNALEALGEIDPAGHLDQMTAGLADPDYRVRRSACLGIARGGKADGAALENLTSVLADENRYNRFYAALALSRLPIDCARDLLMDELFTARWCPITTKDDLY